MEKLWGEAMIFCIWSSFWPLKGRSDKQRGSGTSCNVDTYGISTRGFSHMVVQRSTGDIAKGLLGINMEKQRDILLIEDDFNFGKNLYFGLRTIQHAMGHCLVAPEKIGSGITIVWKCFSQRPYLMI